MRVITQLIHSVTDPRVSDGGLYDLLVKLAAEHKYPESAICWSYPELHPDEIHEDVVIARTLQEQKQRRAELLALTNAEDEEADEEREHPKRALTQADGFPYAPHDSVGGNMPDNLPTY